jgi:hypothetical protein
MSRSKLHERSTKVILFYKCESFNSYLIPGNEFFVWLKRVDIHLPAAPVFT